MVVADSDSGQCISQLNSIAHRNLLLCNKLQLYFFIPVMVRAAVSERATAESTYSPQTAQIAQTTQTAQITYLAQSAQATQTAHLNTTWGAYFTHLDSVGLLSLPRLPILPGCQAAVLPGCCAAVLLYCCAAVLLCCCAAAAAAAVLLLLLLLCCCCCAAAAAAAAAVLLLLCCCAAAAEISAQRNPARVSPGRVRDDSVRHRQKTLRYA